MRLFIEDELRYAETQKILSPRNLLPQGLTQIYLLKSYIGIKNQKSSIQCFFQKQIKTNNSFKDRVNIYQLPI
jgi:hypothetical protein